MGNQQPSSEKEKAQRPSAEMPLGGSPPKWETAKVNIYYAEDMVCTLMKIKENYLLKVNL